MDFFPFIYEVDCLSMFIVLVYMYITQLTSCSPSFMYHKHNIQTLKTFFKAHNSTWPKMKREGHQHGMVRTYGILPSLLNPRPKTKFINQFDSPSTARLFIWVSSKPTYHSKFTSKCGQPRCNVWCVATLL